MDAFKKAARDMLTTGGGALRDMLNTRGGALGAAALVASAIGTYLFWPAGAAAGAVMKAPGAAGFVISRAAFLANPQLYFQILRTAGAAAAAAAFAL